MIENAIKALYSKGKGKKVVKKSKWKDSNDNMSSSSSSESESENSESESESSESDSLLKLLDKDQLAYLQISIVWFVLLFFISDYFFSL